MKYIIVINFAERSQTKRQNANHVAYTIILTYGFGMWLPLSINQSINQSWIYIAHKRKSSNPLDNCLMSRQHRAWLYLQYSMKPMVCDTQLAVQRYKHFLSRPINTVN